MTKESLLKQLEQAQPLFSTYPVDMVYVYGSQVNEQATPLSDIDVALVMSDNIPAKDYMDIELELEVKLNHLISSDKIECRAINYAPLGFQGRVLKEGYVVYIKDEVRRIEFETLTLQKYFDFLPRLNHLTKAALNRIQKEGLLG